MTTRDADRPSIPCAAMYALLIPQLLKRGVGSVQGSVTPTGGVNVQTDGQDGPRQFHISSAQVASSFGPRKLDADLSDVAYFCSLVDENRSEDALGHWLRAERLVTSTHPSYNIPEIMKLAPVVRQEVKELAENNYRNRLKLGASSQSSEAEALADWVSAERTVIKNRNLKAWRPICAPGSTV